MDCRRTSIVLGESSKTTVVTVEEAKTQSRIEDPAEDAFVSSLIADAYDYFAGEAGWLNHCCLLTETFQAYFAGPDDHCVGRIRPQTQFELPMRPVRPEAISAVECLQPDGVTYAALDPTVFYIDFDADTLIATIKQTSPFLPWPSFASSLPAAFRVTFSAGFGNARTDVPGPIRRSIKLLTASMYARREGTVERMPEQEVLYGIRALAGRWRIEPDHS